MSYAANARDPRPDPADVSREPTGPVAADSLAAESLNRSGRFADNEHAEAMGVRGSQSTLANTDTSGADALHPAPSSAVREWQDDLGAGADEKGPGGLKLDALGHAHFDGAHTAAGYSGGAGHPSSGKSAPAGARDVGASTQSQLGSAGDSASSGPAAGTGVRPHVPQAPGYVSTVTGAAMPNGTFKPKGRNLDDADTSGSMPQTKTFIGDVGGVHDPGRLAERDFDSRNADVAAALSSAGVDSGRQRQPRDGESGAVGEEGAQYSVLGSERA